MLPLRSFYEVSHGHEEVPDEARAEEEGAPVPDEEEEGRQGMLIFPRAVYRSPGAIKAGKGLSYDAKRVDDKAAYDEALANGWTHAPLGVPSLPKETPAAPEEPDPADDVKRPTRAELEAEARKIGLKLDSRNTDERLAERILEAMDAAPSKEEAGRIAAKAESGLNTDINMRLVDVVANSGRKA